MPSTLRLAHLPGQTYVNYQKVRLDVATLLVDIGDQTFATSTGSLAHSGGSETVTSMPYGVAMDCKGGGSHTGLANIDLTGMPFNVIDTFTVGGYIPAGTATFSSNDQVVNPTGGGYCGWITPTPWLYNPFNAQGGFRLDLGYIGTGIWEVSIDIKPGSDPNSINLSSAGVVPVAILSSDTFDATTEVDRDTVALAGASVKMVGKSGKLLCHEEDVNEDGFVDLVCKVVTAQFMIEPGDSKAMLEAYTKGGTPIEGEDFIRIVPD
jgi:hypothetical protein